MRSEFGRIHSDSYHSAQIRLECVGEGKVLSAGDFVSVTSSPLRGTMEWVEHITDDSVYLLEYKEKSNVSTSRDDIKVSFILIPADIY